MHTSEPLPGDSPQASYDDSHACQYLEGARNLDFARATDTTGIQLASINSRGRAYRSPLSVTIATNATTATEPDTSATLRASRTAIWRWAATTPEPLGISTAAVPQASASATMVFDRIGIC